LSSSDRTVYPEICANRPPLPPVGWQPSCFLADQAEAKRALTLAERLGSVTAAAAELGTTGRCWANPSPATARACPRNPEAGQEHQLAGLAVEMAGRQLIEQATGRLGYPWCSSAAGRPLAPSLFQIVAGLLARRP
jgi:hypothetical protein